MVEVIALGTLLVCWAILFIAAWLGYRALVRSIREK